MTIEDALTAYIKAFSGITAIITAAGETRFYFDEIPLGKTLPAIVCRCISDVKTHTHQGQSSAESPNYQFTAYASTRSAARALAEQIKTALSDYSGAMSGLTIQYITLLNELPDTLTSADGSVKVCAVVLEFQIIYNRE